MDGSTAGLLVLFVVSLVPLLPTEVTILGMGIAAAQGGTSLALVRWLPSGGTVGALLAGALRWPLGEFLTASAVGVTLWTSYVAFLGYAGGRIITEPGISLLLSLGVAVILGSVITFGMRRVSA